MCQDPPMRGLRSPGVEHEGERTRSCHVIHRDGNVEVDFTRESVEQLLASGGFFWLDLDRPSADDFVILREVFKFHPLAIEDSENFGQRAKIDDYDDFSFLVLFGASTGRGPARRGALLLQRALSRHGPPRRGARLHRGARPVREARAADRARRAAPLPDRRGLVDSFFPLLADFDDRIDELENQTFLNATDAQLQEIFAMKKLLVGLRKAITPQRDMFARLAGGITKLPGMTDRRRALLPRHLRPSDPHQRPRRHVSRPADQLDGRLPVHRLEPAERGDEAADGDRNHLPAARVAHRLLRPELRLDGAQHRQLGGRSSSSASASRSSSAAMMLGYFKRKGWF